MAKQRMRQKKFMAIWIPIITVIFALCLITTIILNTMPKTMDSFFGKGAKSIQNPEGTENWDTNYYAQKETDSSKSEANAEIVCNDVADNGSVLLKNNGVLPLEKDSTVTPFGYGYLEPQYSNITTEYANKTTVAPEGGLKSHYIVNDAAVNKMKNSKAVKIEPAPDTYNGGINALSTDVNLYEYNPSIYTGIENSISVSTAVIYVTRKLGEGFDQKYDAYTDGTPHYLALSQHEKDTIKFAKQNCKSVILIINSGNIMELTPALSGELEVDAILWIGLPGSVGFSSVGRVLSGDVNPSGRTVDIWATDFTKDPTYNNFGEFQYTNADFTPQGYEAMTGLVPAVMNHSFINYDEGLYYGYRYYETAHDISASGYSYGELDGKGAIKTAGAVAFPFGYGLSYTSFNQSIKTFVDYGDEISVTVTIENTGNKPGKDTIQIYYNAPYGSFEVSNKIEKPSAILAAFAKTETIAAKGSTEIILSFPKEDMASYCYTKNTSDGTNGCYVLASGDYKITLRSNSHDIIETKETKINEIKWFDGSDDNHIRQSDKDGQSAMDDDGNLLGYPAKMDSDREAKFIASTNQFQESSDYMNRDTTLLSRDKWNTTFPNPTSRYIDASEIVAKSVNEMFSFDYSTDKNLGNVDGSKVYSAEAPVSKEDNGFSVTDMRGKDYYDKDWELLLNQIDYDNDQSEIEGLLYKTNYGTNGVESLGIPDTVALDGPNGLRTKSLGSASIFPCAPIIAATWDIDLVEDLGEACGQEALTTGCDVLYGIGINLHRSPFGGRNGEYYSEDGLLSGKIAAGFVTGAGNQGLICQIKHFALNDEETNRQFYLHTWADEQTIREIYLKPFEICVKEARMKIKYISDSEGTVSYKVMRATTGVMVSQNCIGSTVNFASYPLLTSVLRDEWGFTGTVITDMYTFMFETDRCNKTWIKDYSIRAGSDLYLTWSADFMGTDYGAADYSSNTARSVVRKSLHNWAYTIANSAVMNGAAPGAIISYGMSPWARLLLVVNIVVDAGVLFIVVMIILRGLDTKKHPENYKQKVQSNIF